MIIESLDGLPPPPPSPCPKLFNYGKNHPTGDIVFPGKDNLYWRGIVRIPGNAVTTGKALHLRVLMSVPTALQTVSNRPITKGNMTLGQLALAVEMISYQG